jgi:phosphatidylserine synthase
MTLAVYYPFSQTDWYRVSLQYLDLQRQGLVVLMLLLAVLMVSNVKYPRFPPIGLRSVRGVVGLLVHLGILAGGLLAPSYFLFPLALAYMLFGLVRATILGLMERREPQLAVDDQLGDSDDDAITDERRIRWGDRRESAE